jgi:hypothetical protein
VYLKKLPILVPPKQGEAMFLYVAATPTVVSAVLVVERQEEKSTKQHPVYFISEVLHDARLRYPNIQKLLYAVLMSSRKLKHYFLCIAYGIKHPQSSVNHPMTNRNVEHANGMILQGIKIRIFDRLKAYDKKWINEVPTVLWAMRTTSSRARVKPYFY